MARFANKKVRILKEATADDGYALFSTTRDVPMLLAFLDQFDRLGWLPPIDAEKRQLLAAHDVIMHEVREDLGFYEFRSKGARGEREPWLTIFFHLAVDASVRICGVEPTSKVERRRDFYINRMRARVAHLDGRLRQRKES